MPDFDLLHEHARKLAMLTAPGQQEPGISSWCVFVGKDWKAIAEMWSPVEPVPANPPSSGVSDAPTPECKCDVEIRANGERLGNATVYVRMCPLHEHALDLYTALAVLLRATEDICSMEGIALLSIAEAEIAETALAKARGEKPNAT